MLKSWSIENFKPIVNSGELELAPVTVLAGRNSSGKSSLLQSILMIAQTLSSKLVDRPLLPNGPIVQLGTFEDILNNRLPSESLKIDFILSFENEGFVFLSPYDDIKLVRISIIFDRNKESDKSFSAIEASKVIVNNGSVQISGNAQEVSLDGSNDDLVEEEYEFSFSFRELTEVESKEFINKITNSHPLHLVPRPQQKIAYLGNFEPANLPSCLVRLSHFLPVGISPDLSEESYKEDLEKFVERLIESTAKVTRFFSSKIRYLGPLRTDGQTSQKFAPSSELDDVGAKGEYAAAVYDANQNAIVKWFNPINQSIEESTLKVALDTWVHYLGVASQVKIETAGQSGFSWQVVHKQGQKPLPLSAVGVGVSQVLPILVMGLLAPTNTLLIVEQPELHLHPSVQARLGDFFMGLAKCNKQCLIETHSENLVSQLRYHIVQAGGMENSDCRIYFVAQDEQGAAKFDLVEISPQGNILNWPEGFFDETMLQEDRITAASIKKRANKAKHA